MLSGSGPIIEDKEIIENDQELDDYIEDWKEALKKQRKEAASNNTSVKIE